MSASIAYLNRGRSRTVSPAALAREASQERLALAARRTQPSTPLDPEKHALAHAILRTDSSPSLTPGPRTPPDNPIPATTTATAKTKTKEHRTVRIHVENPDTTLAPLNPHCAAPQPHIHPPSSPSHVHSYTPSSVVSTVTCLSPPTAAKRPSPPRATTSNLTPPSPLPSALSSFRSQAKARRLASAEAAFSNARARSRRERIAALTARGIEEEAVLERERLAREATEREARRTSVCKTPASTHPRALAYTSRQQTLPHMRGQPPPLPYGLAPLLPYAASSPPLPVPVPVRRALSDRGTPESPRDSQFTYAFPVAAGRLGHWNARAQKGSARTRRALQELLEPAPNPRAVPFEDILAAMRGALFVEPDTREMNSAWPGTRTRARSHDALGEDACRRAWDALMMPPDAALAAAKMQKERQRKQRERRRRRRGEDDEEERVPQDRDCAACAAAWARSLASLEMDTPTLSPTSSAGSSPRSGHSVLATPRSWLPLSLFGREAPAPIVKESPPPSIVIPIADETRHSCGRPQAHCFVAVEVEDTPLGASDADPPLASSSPEPILVPEPAKTAPPTSKRASILAPVSRLLASAAQMHEAYVHATLLSLAAATSSESPSLPPSAPARPPSFRPRGVGPRDVAALGNMILPTSNTDPYLARALDDVRHIPYSLDLSLHPDSNQSPAYPFFLPSYSPGPRARPVAHPAHLRASALLNARRARGEMQKQEEMGLLPERMLGVACDVHGCAARGSRLRCGWKVVWEGEDV